MEAIAKYILAECAAKGTLISNLHMQKILYYCQGYSIKFFDTLLFDAPICKWVYGPTVPKIYYDYNIYGSHKICESGKGFDSGLSLPRKWENCLQHVVDRCVNLPIKTLVCKTRQETPWQNAETGKEIDIASITSYFKVNDPLNIGKALIPVDTCQDYDTMAIAKHRLLSSRPNDPGADERRGSS